MREGADDAGPSRSMSPLPMSRSAPCWSRITRLSVADDTANARRAGTLALITPVMTLTDGRCVAITRWMPTARAIWAMRQIESSTSRAATIIRSASSSITTRMNGRRGNSRSTSPVGDTWSGQVAAVERRVVAGDVAEADLGEEVVAALHLAHRPGQRVGGLLRVRDHLGEQVRQPVVLAHLDALRVDQDHPHLVGRRAHEDRGDQRVEAARLAGAGGSGDEDVGHRGQVEHHGLAVDVPADGHLERVVGPLGLGRGEDVAEGDDLAVGVGHLDADGLATGDRGQDADVGRRHGVGDVLVQAGDAGHLHARAQLELVAGDGRAHHHADELGLDAVLGERVLEEPTGGLDGDLVDPLGAAALEDRHRRQLPGGALAGRADLHLELRGGTGGRLDLRCGAEAAGRRRGRRGKRVDAGGVLVEDLPEQVAVVVVQVVVAADDHAIDVDLDAIGKPVAVVEPVGTPPAEGEQVVAHTAHRAGDHGASGANPVGRALGGDADGNAGEHHGTPERDRDEHERRTPRGDAGREGAADGEAEESTRAGQVLGRSIERRPTTGEVEHACRAQREEQPTDPQMGRAGGDGVVGRRPCGHGPAGPRQRPGPRERSGGPSRWRCRWHRRVRSRPARPRRRRRPSPTRCRPRRRSGRRGPGRGR